MEGVMVNARLNAALLGELNVVNQTFMHAQLLHHLRWAHSAEDAYEFSLAATTRAMQLMLAMQADSQNILFDPDPRFQGLLALNVQATPDRMFEADRRLLTEMIACYRDIASSGPSNAKASAAMAGDSLRGIETCLAASERSGPVEDPSGRAQNSDLRKRFESFGGVWRQFSRGAAPCRGASNRETVWISEVLTACLRFLGQTFVHGFVHRHAGRRGLANLVFARSVDDMRVVYLLTNLALERVGAVPDWLPPPQPMVPQVACEGQEMLANDRASARDLIASIDRALPDQGADPTGYAILCELRRAYEAFLDALDAAAGEISAGSAGGSPDQIAAMLERWGIEQLPAEPASC
jgi:bacterioferritin (cytochrome b1)